MLAAGGSDIDGLLGLLDGHVGAYVYTSSIMAYDQSWVGVFPWTEDQPTNADGATSYGGFKALAEASMLARHSANGFPASVVRPAATFSGVAGSFVPPAKMAQCSGYAPSAWNAAPIG